MRRSTRDGQTGRLSADEMELGLGSVALWDGYSGGVTDGAAITYLLVVGNGPDGMTNSHS